MRITATTGAVFTAAFYTAITACLLAFMTPKRHETWEAVQFSHYWSHTFSPKFRQGTSAVGLAIDICILILPIIGVSRLQMSFRRKLELGVVFTSGIL